jgi:hypothetical protein
MTKYDLFKLDDGEYELSDWVELYHYTLKVGRNEDNSRNYCIREKGSDGGARIFMSEYLEMDEDGAEKKLSALSGVGGLTIHSNDTYSMLRNLKFVK